MGMSPANSAIGGASSVIGSQQSAKGQGQPSGVGGMVGGPQSAKAQANPQRTTLPYMTQPQGANAYTPSPSAQGAWGSSVGSMMNPNNGGGAMNDWLFSGQNLQQTGEPTDTNQTLGLGGMSGTLGPTGAALRTL